MLQLDTENLNTILEIVQAANVHLNADSLRENVLGVIQKVFRSDSCNFFLTDKDGKLVKPVSRNLDQSYLKIYQSRFFRHNPFDPVNLRFLPKMALTDEDLFSLPKFEQTEYFNDFLKPQNISSQMVIYLRSGEKLLGFIGLHRPEKTSRFEERESKVGEVIAPHLTSALEKAQLFARVKEKGDFFRTICDCTSVGFAIFDLKLQPIHLNKRAVEFCSRIRQGDLPFDKEFNERLPLPSEFYENCLSLRHNLSNFPRNLSPPSKQRTLTISHTEKYSIRSEMLDENLTETKGPIFLVTIEKISESRGFDENKLKGEYSLTKREIEIVNYIFKGFKNAEIADLLSISEGTVKNHLKNIFAKMAVENRTSLIHEALSL